MIEALLGAFSAIAVGALSVWGALSASRRSERAQRRQTEAELQVSEAEVIREKEAALWVRMDDRVKALESAVSDLTRRLDESEQARRAQEVTIRKLEDRERDREELIQDFLERHVAVDTWFLAGGYTPPLPDPSWRIVQAVEQYKNELKEVGG